MGRDFLVARGDQRVAATQGMTTEDLMAVCGQVSDVLAPAAAMVATDTPEAVIAAVQPVASSRPQADVVNLGEICLGLGLSRDTPAMSLAGALLLVAAGKLPHAETVGHHVHAGFGTLPDPSKAEAWYLMALDAADRGAAPEILPAQALQRNAVIRAALGEPAAVLPDISLGGGTAPVLPTLPTTP
jgi:hypothetical protein